MNSPRHVLAPLVVVEDNRGDWETVSLLLSEAGVTRALVHCKTGEEALEYLCRLKMEDGPHYPVHILLDLNLPGLSGLEVLNELKRDTRFSQIPITVLTSSSHPRDVESCYRAGANSYMIKPIDFERYEKMLRHFVDYWLETAKLPENEMA